MSHLWRGFALVLMLASAGRVEAQQAGDSTRGKILVEAECLACHGDKTLSPRAPGFQDVARMPSTTALSLGVFLRTSHPTMPNILLSPADLDDVIAYILTLRSP